MDRLKGKVAMVVGAGSIGPGWGNGKATAVTFAREGAQVFCVDRNGTAAEETAKIIKDEGGQATPFTADVSRSAEIEAMVRRASRPMAASTCSTTMSASPRWAAWSR
jgi:NAD(P)-dependent dehydrogenase (short-subunit alcohol dehydrogenase family)